MCLRTLFASLALLAFSSTLRAADTQPAPKLTPAPDTTLITSPLNPDGTPNYLQALNDELSKGITPENNAAIPLLKALGPGSIHNKKIAPIVLRQLHLDLPATGNYFTYFASYARKKHEAASHDPFDSEAAAKLEDAAEKSPWKPDQFPLVVEWLASIDEPLKQISAAADRPRFFCPMASEKSPPSLNDGAFTFPLGALRSLAQAFITRAMLHLGQADFPAATADILIVHRLARLEAQEPFLINALVAVAIDKVAFQAQATLLKSPTLTPEQARQVLTDITTLSDIPAAEDILHAERFFLLDSLMPAVRGNPGDTLALYTSLYGTEFLKAPPPPPNTLDQVDWNIALRALNRRADAIDAACKLPLASQRHQAFAPLQQKEIDAKVPVSPLDLLTSLTAPTDSREKINQRYLHDISEFLTKKPNESVPDFSRRIILFFNRPDPADEKAFILLDRVTATRRLTLLAAALAVHHAQNNTYPKTLDDLAPLLPNHKIPPDPFTAKPFLYQPTAEGYLLYSTGDNAADDHAHDQSSTPKADDIVLHMP